MSRHSHATAKRAPTPSLTPVAPGTLQRYGGKRQEELSRMRQGNGDRGPSASVLPIVEDVLRSPGEPLDAATRAFFEPRFGHDFSRVRVHSDDRAAASARAVNAVAYTVGRNIAFDLGRYDPTTRQGQRLLAHELTHVAQQDRQMPARLDKLTMTQPGASSEREADRAAAAVIDGASFRPGTTNAATLARQVDAGVADAGPSPTAPAAKVPAAEKSPLDQARDLVTESPSSAKDRAKWILSASEEGFVTFNTKKQRQDVEDIRDEKKVGSLDPTAKNYLPILAVEVGLIKSAVQRWIDDEGKGSKPTIELGSLIRSGKDPHASGKAIDINKLKMVTSVDATITIIKDLDKSLHASYGIGLPFQGEFFDPSDELGTKKKIAESAAPKRAAAPSDAAAAGKGSPGSTISVKDGLKKFYTYVYGSTGTLKDGVWSWTDTVQDAGGAHKHLKSQLLKDALAQKTKDGFTLVIFPDNDDHLHLDVR